MISINSHIEVISFDIGNTLINLDGIQGFCTFFCQITGMKVDDIRGILNDYFLKRNVDIEDAVSEVCSILGIGDYKMIISEYQKKRLNTTVFPDVVSALMRLRNKGYKIIACSNCVKWDADDPDGILHDNIDKIFYSFEIGYAKPDLGFFNYVTNSMQVEKSKFLHIGDSLIADYYAAREAGWESILIDRNGKHRNLAEFKIDSLDQLF